MNNYSKVHFVNKLWTPIKRRVHHAKIEIYAASRSRTFLFRSNCGVKKGEFAVTLCFHGEADGRLLVVEML